MKPFNIQGEIMKIVSWNIMQGGGKRVRSIINKIIRTVPDILIMEDSGTMIMEYTSERNYFKKDTSIKW